jgi:hypothetical protein
MPTYLEDITWAAMSDAGIDTDKVTRQHTETGDDVYVFIDGDLKIAFGPGAGEDGNTKGYDVACYEYADGGWDPVRTGRRRCPNYWTTSSSGCTVRG